MKTSQKGDWQYGNRGILANFQFYVDKNEEEICEGITLSISAGGFNFMTETEIRQGQTITVTKHALRGYSCPKATVTWVKRGTRCIEAGAEFYCDKRMSTHAI